MLKSRIIKVFAVVIAVTILSFSVTLSISDSTQNQTESAHETKEVNNEAYFEDIPDDAWYKKYVTELAELEIIPFDSKYNGKAPVTRGDIALYLFNMSASMSKIPEGEIKTEFSDVDINSSYYNAASWAHNNGILTSGNDGKFLPRGECTVEELSVAIYRYLAAAQIKAPIKGSSELFSDWESISESARSSVMVLKLAGILHPDADGCLCPRAIVNRGYFAQILHLLNKACSNQVSDGEEMVNLEPDAYMYLYSNIQNNNTSQTPVDTNADYNLATEDTNNSGNNSYSAPTPIFTPEQTSYENSVDSSSDGGQSTYVSEREAVDLSYFDDAIFVGDSVSMSLQYYCASTSALGNAKFLCAGSLSPANALRPVTEKSVHPIYNGEKVTVEDGVALSGARKVYIMLGINSMVPFESNVRNMKTLVDRILEKSPGVEIIFQTVTPMIANGPIATASLNNGVITSYNQRLYDMAKQNGWYYINVAEAVSDENGFLRNDYCSDPSTMGIHFNYSADAAWVNYLITHAPRI